jgi:hypothetical protein
MPMIFQVIFQHSGDFVPMACILPMIFIAQLHQVTVRITARPGTSDVWRAIGTRIIPGDDPWGTKCHLGGCRYIPRNSQ